MRRRFLPAGFSTLFLVIIVLLILFAIISAYCILQKGSPGGAPMQILLSPVTTNLVPGVPATFTIQVALEHPLPNVRKQFQVKIDEDDVWDDTLLPQVTVTYDPTDHAHPYAWGQFQLVCRNLHLDETFDLVGEPRGGTSSGEVTHQVHGEGPGTASANVVVRCPIPEIGIRLSEAQAGDLFCVYTVKRVSGTPLARVNDKVCVRCAKPGQGCPSVAVLTFENGDKLFVEPSGACRACPSDARQQFTTGSE